MKLLNTPSNLMGYDLLEAGTFTLAKVERNGIRIDRDYCKAKQVELKKRVRDLYDEILETKEGKVWKEKFGKETNLFSNKQLDTVLYEALKLKAHTYTANGNNAVDETALMKFEKKVSFVRKYIEMKKLDKAQSTYLENFLFESSQDGYIHPFFDLSTTNTYRSSSFSPNFQNIPIRNKVIGPMLRKALIPREGNLLLEADYSGIEVRGAACYHKDKNMISYINDSSKDMHRDMAMQIYFISLEDMQKPYRQAAKNSYVFPSFYGSYYKQTAKDLWERIETDPLKKDGVLLYEHLKKHNINTYSQFEEHIKAIDKDFWENRFPEYNQWKIDWYNEYLRYGFFDSLTGFHYRGYMKRNDVINYPVQGSSFHCLLWSIIHIQKEFEERELQSKIIGQIHDSVIIDVVPDELNIIVNILHEIMTKSISTVWDWIIIPLEIEIEVSRVDHSWSDKKPLVNKPCRICSNKNTRHVKKENYHYECPICYERI